MKPVTPIPSPTIVNLPNLGAIIKIEVILAEFISLSDPNSKNEVSEKTTQDWNQLNFTQETCLLKETSKPVKQGVLFNVISEWLMPNVNYDSATFADSILGKPVSIKFTTANGMTLIIGDINNPARVYINKDIPLTVASFNSFYFLVNYKSSHPIYFVA